MSNDKDTVRWGDRSLRFLFEHADIRGETVHLNDSYAEILAIHQYAPGVASLLGEFLAASALLASTIKFEGKLILQARSEGQIPLMMAECTSDLAVRGIVRGAEQATGTSLAELMPAGQLAITIDPAKGQRYQGVVPLDEESLAHSLQSYFQQSEQLDTRFWLTSDGQGRAAGMLLQQLPAQLAPDRERENQWEHARSLAATITPDELLDLPAPELLHRLYHEESLRLFEPASVAFHCSCSRERIFNALGSLAEADIRDLLAESGEIATDCEFCNQRYVFTDQDLSPLLPGNDSPTLH